MSRIALLVTALAAAGCSLDGGVCEAGDVAPPAGDGAVDRVRRVAEILPVEHRAIDLLFVIDDSRSMADEQEQLGLWSRELFDVLAFDGELADLHIAVISSSLTVPGIEGCDGAGDGRFHAGDAALGGDSFLVDVAGPDGRERNYEGSLTGAFAEMARVGEYGCGFEQPFAATRLALSGALESNRGFLRDDALLVVVFVSDEDDCSVTDPTLFTGDRDGDVCSELGAQTSFRCFEFGVTCRDGKRAREHGARAACGPDEGSPYLASVAGFAAFLSGLKKHPGEVVVAGVYGKPNEVVVGPDPRFFDPATPRLLPACESATASATPAIRLNALLAAFPARAAQSSICEPELSWALRRTALVTRRVATRSRCLAGAAVAPTCRAFAIADRGTELERRVEIPGCDGSAAGRCFALEPDPLACGDTATGLALRLDPPQPAAGETLEVECELAENATADRLSAIGGSVPDE